MAAKYANIYRGLDNSLVIERLCAKRELLMEKEIIFNVDESPEGGYEARALGFSIFTQADTFDELKKMVQDAVLCHFDEKDRPRVIRLHMVKEELLAV